MNILILNGPPDPRPGHNPLYRGTHRAHPSHCDQLPDSHEINQLFFWFLEEGGELGVVRNVDKALRFAELWNTHLNERRDRFEVVEVTDENTRCESNGTFIGYDLSAGYNNSLLRSGLKFGGNRVAEPIEELLDLINRHYAPQLNGQGLFQTWEVAFGELAGAYRQQSGGTRRKRDSHGFRCDTKSGSKTKSGLFGTG